MTAAPPPLLKRRLPAVSLTAVRHRNKNRKGNRKGKHFVGDYRKKKKIKVERGHGPCLGVGHTRHARCTRTRIAHARTQQNHRVWGTLSPLTSKSLGAHRECHGGVFPVVVIKGASVATEGLAIGKGENNTAEGLAPHATSPRLLVVVPRLHVVVARHGHLLVVLHCFCSF